MYTAEYALCSAASVLWTWKGMWRLAEALSTGPSKANWKELQQRCRKTEKSRQRTFHIGHFGSSGENPTTIISGGWNTSRYTRTIFLRSELVENTWRKGERSWNNCGQLVGNIHSICYSCQKSKTKCWETTREGLVENHSTLVLLLCALLQFLWSTHLVLAKETTVS